MGGVPVPNFGFLIKCDKFKVIDGKQVWRNKVGNRFYTWDSLHGEIETFDKQGFHLGALDPSGSFKKDPVRGRRLNV